MPVLCFYVPLTRNFYRSIFMDEMVTRIHVNGHKIKSNRQRGAWEPVITAKSGKTNRYGYRVDLLDKDGNVIASVLQSRKPLSCGAVVWVETELNIRVHTE